jgi:uncharacterized membrane protein
VSLDGTVAPGMAPPAGRYGRLLLRLEGTEAWDGAVDVLEPVARRLVARQPVRRLLHGDSTGIPLHVILTDLPFGAWFMALYLDLFADAGSRRAASRLVGLGVVTSAPAALAGWAEWALADRAVRRVGLVHATLNGCAALVFAASWAARVRERHGLGAGLGRLGGAVLVAGGFLGGHMGRGRRPGPPR